MFDLKLTNMSNEVEVVSRGRETQLHVGENLNKKT